MRIPVPRPRRPVMSLTPLIDVVFILLLFFMLASSFDEWSTLPLAVPDEGQTIAADDSPRLVIALDASGALRYDGVSMADDAVVEAVSASRRTHPGVQFVVRVDAEVAVQRMVDVLDLLSQAGVEDAALQRGAG